MADTRKQSPPKTAARGLNAWARYTTLGMQFALSIALPTVGGYYLDDWLGTLPLFLILLALIGTVAAIVLIVRATKPTTHDR